MWALPARDRPLLLASAASLDDVEAAIAAGADLVDLKDPDAGALGACDQATLAGAAALRDRLDPARPLSAAIGEARDRRAPARAAAAARVGFDFLKAGLDGVTDSVEATALLGAIARAARGAAPAVSLVAATYGDPVPGGALDLDALPEAAQRAGCVGCLLDTAVKDGRTLLDHRDEATILRFIAAARSRGLLVALAGALDVALVARVATLGPDIIGLRGALCAGGRSGRIDPARVRRVAALLAPAPDQASAR